MKDLPLHLGWKIRKMLHAWICSCPTRAQAHAEFKRKEWTTAIQNSAGHLMLFCSMKHRCMLAAASFCCRCCQMHSEDVGGGGGVAVFFIGPTEGSMCKVPSASFCFGGRHFKVELMEIHGLTLAACPI